MDQHQELGHTAVPTPPFLPENGDYLEGDYWEGWDYCEEKNAEEPRSLFEEVLLRKKRIRGHLKFHLEHSPKDGQKIKEKFSGYEILPGIYKRGTIAPPKPFYSKNVPPRKADLEEIEEVFRSVKADKEKEHLRNRIPDATEIFNKVDDSDSPPEETPPENPVIMLDEVEGGDIESCVPTKYHNFNTGLHFLPLELFDSELQEAEKKGIEMEKDYCVSDANEVRDANYFLGAKTYSINFGSYANSTVLVAEKCVGKRGHSLLYVEGKHLWVPCEVVEYVAEKQAYLIEWMNDIPYPKTSPNTDRKKTSRSPFGIRVTEDFFYNDPANREFDLPTISNLTKKWVRRFAFVLEDDNKYILFYRMEKAQSLRKTYEEEYRMQLLVDSLSYSAVGGPWQNVFDLNAVINSEVLNLKNCKKIDKTNLDSLIENNFQTLHHEYMKSMKKAGVIYRLSKPTVEQKYAEMGINASSSEKYKYGYPRERYSDFKEIQTKLHNTLILRDPLAQLFLQQYHLQSVMTFDKIKKLTKVTKGIFEIGEYSESMLHVQETLIKIICNEWPLWVNQSLKDTLDKLDENLQASFASLEEKLKKINVAVCVDLVASLKKKHEELKQYTLNVKNGLIKLIITSTRAISYQFVQLSTDLFYMRFIRNDTRFFCHMNYEILSDGDIYTGGELILTPTFLELREYILLQFDKMKDALIQCPAFRLRITNSDEMGDASAIGTSNSILEHSLLNGSPSLPLGEYEHFMESEREFLELEIAESEVRCKEVSWKLYKLLNVDLTSNAFNLWFNEDDDWGLESIKEFDKAYSLCRNKLIKLENVTKCQIYGFCVKSAKNVLLKKIEDIFVDAQRAVISSLGTSIREVFLFVERVNEATSDVPEELEDCHNHLQELQALEIDKQKIFAQIESQNDIYSAQQLLKYSIGNPERELKLDETAEAQFFTAHQIPTMLDFKIASNSSSTTSVMKALQATFAEEIDEFKQKIDLIVQGCLTVKTFEDMEMTKVESDYLQTAITEAYKECQKLIIHAGLHKLSEIQDYLSVINSQLKALIDSFDVIIGWPLLHKKSLNDNLENICIEHVEDKIDLYGTIVEDSMSTLRAQFGEGLHALLEAAGKEITMFKIGVEFRALQVLKNKYLRDRHFFSICSWLNINGEAYFNFGSCKLRILLDSYDFEKNIETIENIVFKAKNEYSIEKEIKTIRELIGSTVLDLYSHIVLSTRKGSETTTTGVFQKIQNFVVISSNRKYIPMVRNYDPISRDIEQYLTQIQILRSSPFVGPFEDDVRDLESLLNLIILTMELLFEVQKEYIRVEPIFFSQGLRDKLPKQVKAFESAIFKYKGAITEPATSSKGYLARFVSSPNLINNLKECQAEFDACIANLNNWLMKKRVSFGRLFFLSEPEMLDILSFARDPKALDRYMPSCFEGISSLIVSDKMQILGAKSETGETLLFPKPILTQNDSGVDSWILSVQNLTEEVLRAQLCQALETYHGETTKVIKGNVGMRRKANHQTYDPALDHEMFSKFVSQIINISFQVKFGIEVEHILEKRGTSRAVANLKKKYKKVLSEIVDAMQPPEVSKAEREYLWAKEHIMNPSNKSTIQSSGPSKSSAEARKMTMSAIFARQNFVLSLLSIVDQLEAIEGRDKLSLGMFEWLSLLKYKVDNGNLAVHQGFTKIWYGWEYLGGTERLVITPATNRCFLNMATSLKLKLGTTIFGPSSAGKSSTIKDFAYANGRRCIVVNCCEYMVNHAVCNILRGICCSTTWVCLDEMDRMTPETLSVFSGLFYSIHVALNNRKKKLVLGSCEINLTVGQVCGVGLFGNIHPGSFRRHDLPDNLQSLFRNCSLAAPDVGIILEAILCCRGFTSASSIARRVLFISKLANELLKPPAYSTCNPSPLIPEGNACNDVVKSQYYDFGVRTCKLICIISAKLREDWMSKSHLFDEIGNSVENDAFNIDSKEYNDDEMSLQNATSTAEQKEHTRKLHKTMMKAKDKWRKLHTYVTEMEQKVVYEAMTVCCLPRLADSDVDEFSSLVHSIFPSGGIDKDIVCEFTSHASEDFYYALSEAMGIMNLQPGDVFVEKVRALYESVQTYSGVIITGSTMTGKTAIWQCLALTRGIMKRNSSGPDLDVDVHKYIQTFVINPKALKRGEILGHFNGNEWHYGVLSRFLKDLWETNNTTEPYWIIFDGPMDSVFMEDISSFLDESKTLFLMNGERIFLPPNITIIFEVETVSNVSLGAISVCGQVHAGSSVISWNLLLKSWSRSVSFGENTAIIEKVESLCALFLDDVTNFLNEGFWPSDIVMEINKNHIFQNFFDLLEATIQRGLTELNKGQSGVEGENPTKDEIELVIEAIFGFAIINTFGSLVMLPVRTIFDSWFRNFTVRNNLEGLLPLLEKLTRVDKFNEQHDFSDPDNTVFDYYFNVSINQWAAYSSSLADDALHESITYYDCFINTVETARCHYLLQNLLLCGKHPVCMGPAGCGKTLAVENLLFEHLPFEFDGHRIDMSHEVSVHRLQKEIEKLLICRNRVTNTYGSATVGKKILVFLDNIDLPKSEVFGVQSDLELIRQWMDYGGWYSPSDKRFKHILDLHFIASMRTMESFPTIPEYYSPSASSKFLPINGEAERLHNRVQNTSSGPIWRTGDRVSRRLVRHFVPIFFGGVYLEKSSSWFQFKKILSCQLDNNLSNTKFNVSEVVFAFNSASITLYSNIIANFPPVPSKPNYIFNLHSLHQVFSAVCNTVLSSSSFPEEGDHLQNFYCCWVAEHRKVFRDCLINDKDKNLFDDCLGRVVDLKLPFVLNEWRSLANERIYLADRPQEKPSFISNFLKAEPTGGASKLFGEDKPKAKLECRYFDNLSTYKEHLEVLLKRYNETMPTQIKDLVVVDEVALHISHITRSIFNYSGNCFLLGPNNIFRESMVRLSSFLCDCPVVHMKGTFDEDRWRKELKSVCLKATVEDCPLVLLIDHARNIPDKYLEDITLLGGNGFIPRLWEEDELMRLIDKMHSYTVEKKKSKTKGEKRTRRKSVYVQRKNSKDINVTKFELFVDFVKRVSSNVHIVCCANWDFVTLRKYSVNFPNLFNLMSMSYCKHWAPQTLAQFFQEELRFIRRSKGNFGKEFQTTLEEYALTANKESTPKSAMELAVVRKDAEAIMGGPKDMFEDVEKIKEIQRQNEAKAPQEKKGKRRRRVLSVSEKGPDYIHVFTEAMAYVYLSVHPDRQANIGDISKQAHKILGKKPISRFPPLKLLEFVKIFRKLFHLKLEEYESDLAKLEKLVARHREAEKACETPSIALLTGYSYWKASHEDVFLQEKHIKDEADYAKSIFTRILNAKGDKLKLLRDELNELTATEADASSTLKMNQNNYYFQQSLSIPKFEYARWSCTNLKLASLKSLGAFLTSYDRKEVSDTIAKSVQTFIKLYLLLVDDHSFIARWKLYKAKRRKQAGGKKKVLSKKDNENSSGKEPEKALDDSEATEEEANVGFAASINRLIQEPAKTLYCLTTVNPEHISDHVIEEIHETLSGPDAVDELMLEDVKRESPVMGALGDWLFALQHFNTVLPFKRAISATNAHILQLQKNVVSVRNEMKDLQKIISSMHSNIGSCENIVSKLESVEPSFARPWRLYYLFIVKFNTDCKDERTILKTKVLPQFRRLSYEKRAVVNIVDSNEKNEVFGFLEARIKEIEKFPSDVYYATLSLMQLDSILKFNPFIFINFGSNYGDFLDQQGFKMMSFFLRNRYERFEWLVDFEISGERVSLSELQISHAIFHNSSLDTYWRTVAFFRGKVFIDKIPLRERAFFEPHEKGTEDRVNYIKRALVARDCNVESDYEASWAPGNDPNDLPGDRYLNHVLSDTYGRLTGLEEYEEYALSLLKKTLNYALQMTEDEADLRDNILTAETSVREAAREVTVLEEDLNNDLAAAVPIIDNAIKAIQSVTKSQLIELRSFMKPPAQVINIINTVMILFRVPRKNKAQQFTWEEAKKLMNSRFIERILSFNKDDVPDEILKELGPIIKDPKFDPENVASSSKATAAIAIWVRAVYKYAIIMKDVVGKKEKLAKASALLIKKKEQSENLTNMRLEMKQIDHISMHPEEGDAQYELLLEKLSHTNTDTLVEIRQSFPESIIAEILCVLLHIEPLRVESKKHNNTSDFFQGLISHFREESGDENVGSSIAGIKPLFLSESMVRKLASLITSRSFYIELSAMESIYATNSKAVTLYNMLVWAKHVFLVLMASNRCLERAKDRGRKLVSLTYSKVEKWEAKKMEAMQGLNTLLGDILLSSACVTFWGILPTEERGRVFIEWTNYLSSKKIRFSRQFSFVNILNKPSVLARWITEGLPSDICSIENATIISWCTQCALVVDRESHTLEWAKKKYVDESNSRKFVGASNQTLPLIVEEAFRSKHDLLITNVGKIDIFFDKILKKETIFRNGEICISIRDDEYVPFDEKIKIGFYSSDIEITPDLLSKLNIVHWSLSEEYLLLMLKNILLKHQSPHSFDRESDFAEKIVEYTEILEKCADRELSLISEASSIDDKLLEDVEKNLVLESESHASLEIVEKDLAKLRERGREFDDLVQECASYFECCFRLERLNPFYRFSVASFLAKFKEIVLKKFSFTGNSSLNRVTIANGFLASLYPHVCCALISEHKLALNTLLILNRMKFHKNSTSRSNSAGHHNEDNTDLDKETAVLIIPDLECEWQNLELRVFLPNPKPSVIPSEAWQRIERLATFVPAFCNLAREIGYNVDEWCSYVYPSMGRESRLPPEAKDKYTPLQRLLIWKAMKPNLFIQKVGEFVFEMGGIPGVSSSTKVSFFESDFRLCYEEADSSTPILLLPQPGVDVIYTVRYFARKMNMHQRLNILNLGRENTLAAERVIARAIFTGDWVLLLNVQHCGDWINNLQRIVDLNMASDKVHTDFRLWISYNHHHPEKVIEVGSYSENYGSQATKKSRNTKRVKRDLSANEDTEIEGLRPEQEEVDISQESKLPMRLIHESIKLSIDASFVGIKNGMEHLYACYDEEIVNSSFYHVEPEPYHTFLFCLSYLHSAINERQRYGAVGRAVLQRFSVGDALAAIYFLRLYLEEITESKLDVKSFGAFINEVVYSSKISLIWDERVTHSLIASVFTQKIHNGIGFRLSYCKRFKLPNLMQANETGNYLSVVKAHINRLPMEAHSSALGLNYADEREAMIQRGNDFLRTMNCIIKSVPMKDTLRDIMYENPLEMDMDLINICDGILKDLPQPFSYTFEPQKFKNSPKREYLRLLAQEVRQYNDLRSLIHDSLIAIKQAYYGQWTDANSFKELKVFIIDLKLGTVPHIWTSKAFISSCSDISSFIKELCARFEYVFHWIQSGFPVIHWPNALFSPRALYYATINQFAVSSRQPVDSILMETVFLSEGEVRYIIENRVEPSEGCYISGLDLEGANYDHNRKSLTKRLGTEATAKAPVIWLRPYVGEENSSLIKHGASQTLKSRSSASFSSVLNLEELFFSAKTQDGCRSILEVSQSLENIKRDQPSVESSETNEDGGEGNILIEEDCVESLCSVEGERSEPRIQTGNESVNTIWEEQSEKDSELPVEESDEICEESKQEKGVLNSVNGGQCDDDKLGDSSTEDEEKRAVNGNTEEHSGLFIRKKNSITTTRYTGIHEHYLCPVFATKSRTALPNDDVVAFRNSTTCEAVHDVDKINGRDNHLFTVSIQSLEPVDVWIAKGVALTCRNFSLDKSDFLHFENYVGIKSVHNTQRTIRE
eukprot:Nk52_evm40s1073 gene=Nk52_evmTU40s1073